MVTLDSERRERTVILVGEKTSGKPGCRQGSIYSLCAKGSSCAEGTIGKGGGNSSRGKGAVISFCPAEHGGGSKGAQE